MPVLGTVLLGILGQAAWKLATSLYDRITGPGAAAQPASTAASFASSLAEARSTAAVGAPGAVQATARLPEAPAISAIGTTFFGAARPPMANVLALYQRMGDPQAA